MPRALPVATTSPKTRDTIRRFNVPLRRNLWAFSARSARCKQVLRSFPAAAAAIAMRPAGDPGARVAIELIETGAPLGDVARALGLPPWLRHLPPEAFLAPPVWRPGPPDEDARLGARLLNLLPDAPQATAGWLDTVIAAREAGGNELAIWLAGQKHVWSPRGQLPPVRLLALYAWHSERSDGAAGRLVETGWSPRLGLRRAVIEARAWLIRVLEGICGCGVPPSWRGHRLGPVAGLAVVPLTSPLEIAEEGRAMDHCADLYASAVMLGECRLYSLRRGRARVATMELRRHPGDGEPYLRQLAGRGNALPSETLRAAVEEWVEREATALGLELDPEFGPESEAAFRRMVWEPYAHDKTGREAGSGTRTAPTIAAMCREMERLRAFEK